MKILLKNQKQKKNKSTWKKKKREDAKKAKEEEEKKQQLIQQQKNPPRKGKPPQIDEDPNGNLFLKIPDKLSEAHKHLQRLTLYANDNIQTHLLNFEVAMHRKKYLVAFKSVNKGRKLALDNPWVHQITVRLFAFSGEMNPLVKQVIQEEKDSVLKGRSLTEFNEQFFKYHSMSLAARHAYTQCAILLDSSKKQDYLRNLHSDLGDTGFYPLEETSAVHKYFLKEAPDLAVTYAEQAKSKFPLATYFNPEEDKEDEKPTTTASSTATTTTENKSS